MNTEKLEKSREKRGTKKLLMDQNTENLDHSRTTRTSRQQKKELKIKTKQGQLKKRI